MKGFLQLENGMTIEGKLFGYINERIPGEVVFNTSMTGYQEVLTDPSYYGQIVTMTYPLIGNYGINFDYEQSKGCKVKGFIVKEYCTMPNNFNNEMTLTDYLENEKITGLCDVDTKKLTKILRNQRRVDINGAVFIRRDHLRRNHNQKPCQNDKIHRIGI